MLRINDLIEQCCVAASLGPVMATLIAGRGPGPQVVLRVTWEAPLARPPVLTVRAPSVSDAVILAGGFICDGVLSGWEVAVHTADSSLFRALRILGAGVVQADPHDLDDANPTVCEIPARDQRPAADELRHVISVAAAAFKVRAIESANIDCSATAFPAVETFRLIAVGCPSAQ